MSNIGIAYKRAFDLTELAASPADGDYFVIVDISDANREKKILASRIVSSGGINLADTISSTTGVISKDGTRFLHNFHDPTGGGAIPDGYNIFLGESAGNFTAGSTATNAWEASKNIGIGENALVALTLGYRNVGIGYNTLNDLTSATDNVVIGASAGEVIIGGSGNTILGSTSGSLLTSGGNNVFAGADAASNAVTTANSIVIGANSYPSGNGNTNEIVIGEGVTGLGSNTVIIGDESITNTTLKGTVNISALNQISYEGAAIFYEGNAVFN